MDILSNSTMEVSKLALDGLMARQQAISSNIANVMTPDYQRQDVYFESQLQEMIAKDDLKEYIKLENSAQYQQHRPSSFEEYNVLNQQPKSMTIQKAQFLQSDIYKDFSPQIVEDTNVIDPMSGNNVDLEQEVMQLAKNGTKYSVLSSLMSHEFKVIGSVIKGQ